MINPKARPCEEATIRSVRAAPGCTREQKAWILAVAVLGTIAISALNRTLDTDLASARASPEVTIAVDSAPDGPAKSSAFQALDFGC